MSIEFKEFPKIERINGVYMSITQKIHGTNAQVYIYQDENNALQLLTGSRTRWITPENDNYGFASFVCSHKQEFIDKLGPGQHFGEWAGPGINSGEGLAERTFILFDFWKYPQERLLPPCTMVVPVLYKGGVDFSQIDLCMSALKEKGSLLVPGFMRPEGVVVLFAKTRYKKVFQAEETKWKGADEVYAKARILAKENGPDLSHLLQPLRLEKLLSRDENYRINFPSSIQTIVDDYISDLVIEGVVLNTPEEVKSVRRNLGGSLFKFIREGVEG